MKTARTHVFVFVPILAEWVPHTRAPIASRGGSNGSTPPEQKPAERPRWQVRHGDGWGTQALPNHLFWTWFVDNPRPQLSK